MYLNGYKFMQCAILLFCALLCSQIFARNVTLKWQEVQNSSGYEVEVLQFGKKIESKKVTGGALKWKHGFPSGLYLYHVRALDKDQVPGSWTEMHYFAIPMEAPTLQTPAAQAKLETPATKEIVLTWSDVASAVGYSVEVTYPDNKKTNMETKLPTLNLNIEMQGEYHWSVQPLWKEERTKEVSIPKTAWKGPQSETGAFMVGTPRDVASISEIKESLAKKQDKRTTLTPYATAQVWSHTYSMASSLTASGGSTQTVSSGFEVGLEYEHNGWGGKFSMEDSVLSIEGIKSHLLGFSLVGLKRLHLSERLSLISRVGASSKEYLEINTIRPSTAFVPTKLGTIGAGAELTLEFAFTPNFSVDLFAKYFAPMSFLGSRGGRVMSLKQNLENYTTGAETRFALTSQIQALAIVALRSEQLSYKNGGSTLDSIHMKGVYLGAGLLLPFGE